MKRSRKISTENVCGMCGHAGYAEKMVTCFRCKKVSEHIYCMPRQLYFVPKVWQCEECAQNYDLNRKDIPSGHPNAKEARAVARGSLSPNNNYQKHSTPTKSPSSGIHATKPVPCSPPSKMVKSGKTKFIPPEIAASLPLSAEKRTVSSTRPTLGGVSAQANQVKNRHLHIAHRTSITTLGSEELNVLHMEKKASVEINVLHLEKKGSVSAEVKEPNALHMEAKGNVSAQVQLSHQKLSTENAPSNKEGNLQCCRVPGDMNSDGLCKRGPLEGSLTPGSHQSLVQGIIPTKSKHGLVCLTPPKDEESKRIPRDEQKRATTKALVHAAHVKKESHSMCIKEEYGECCMSQMNQTEPECLEGNGIRTSEARVQDDLNPHKMIVGFGSLQTDSSVNALLTDGSGKIICSSVELKKPQSRDANPPGALAVVSSTEDPSCLITEAKWKGDFEIDTVSEIHHGIQAHVLGKVNFRVYEILKELPEKIKCTLCRRQDVWPKVFRLDPPAIDDIALFFYPCEMQRSKDAYTKIVDMMDRCDLALKSWIGDAELLIYTSGQLLKQKDSPGLPPGVPMWGVFRHKHKRSQAEVIPPCHNINVRNSRKSLSETSTANITPAIPPGFPNRFQNA